MSAQLEKIIIDAYLIQVQQLLPDSNQLLFKLIAWQLIIVSR